MEKKIINLIRPESLEDIIGQTHLLNESGLINRIVKNHFTPNLIFYGPPGVGKTSMAISLSNDLKIKYNLFNAANDKKEKLINIFNNASEEEIIIIDEIHRMNRNLQDTLLEKIENRKIILYCTTTENPYFVINPAIRSRSTIVKLKDISNEDIHKSLIKVIEKNNLKINISDENMKYISELSNGDYRVALNSIILLCNLYGDETISDEIINSVFNSSNIIGSSYGDEFHNLKSAFQKSIRGSDVDASLHYWARLMSIGDYESIMRRIMIIAYEDIGLANPAIPPRVIKACEAFRQIGMPEGRYCLGMAVIEMALSEKSNSSSSAIDLALSEVEKGNLFEIPNHLHDNHYKSAVKLNAGVGYKYPHSYPGNYVVQQYLPNQIKDKKYFTPQSSSKYEQKLIKIYYDFINKKNK